MTLVVDASAWYLQAVADEADPRATAAKAHLPALTESDVLVAPWLLAYELANLVHAKHRGLVATRRQREENLRLLLDGIVLMPTDWTRLGVLAEECKLSAYDAAYLELAERLGAGLVTEDAVLLRAARQRLGDDRAFALAAAVA